MSEVVLNCSSGDKEKLTAHAAWIESTRRAVTILAVAFCTVLAISYIVSEGMKSKLAEIELRNEKAITKLQTETAIRIERLEEDVKELKEACKKAERDYAAARQAISRIRREK